MDHVHYKTYCRSMCLDETSLRIFGFLTENTNGKQLAYIKLNKL